jgi:hypothetical protein
MSAEPLPELFTAGLLMCEDIMSDVAGGLAVA